MITYVLGFMAGGFSAAFVASIFTEHVSEEGSLGLFIAALASTAALILTK